MIGLSLGQVLSARLSLECKVCRQLLDVQRADDDAIDVALFGKVPYAQCPSCRQIVPDRHDQNYRRRVRRFDRART